MQPQWWHGDGALQVVLNVPEVGDEVEAGDVVATLESMKMEVQIKSAISGVIREILVKNGAQVKSGQALVFVEPANDAAVQANPTTVMPWTSQDVIDSNASERLRAAFLGWDFRANQTKDASLADPKALSTTRVLCRLGRIIRAASSWMDLQVRHARLRPNCGFKL